jgi:hypothetical protein
VVSANGRSPAELERVSRSEVVNVGSDLRLRLELVARREGRDATSLARFLIREHVEQKEKS